MGKALHIKSNHAALVAKFEVARNPRAKKKDMRSWKRNGAYSRPASFSTLFFFSPFRFLFFFIIKNVGIFFFFYPKRIKGLHEARLNCTDCRLLLVSLDVIGWSWGCGITSLASCKLQLSAFHNIRCRTWEQCSTKWPGGEGLEPAHSRDVRWFRHPHAFLDWGPLQPLGHGDGS